jgi:hypothetical protein
VERAVTWTDEKAGLIKFAAKVDAPLPADHNDQMQGRRLVSRLCSCVAQSNTASCHA